MASASAVQTNANQSRNLLIGAEAGLAGGVVFGLMMQMMGMIGTIGGLVGQMGNVPISWMVHLVISAIIGAGFGLVAPNTGSTASRILVAGALYGLIWWILGPLLIMPILMGMGPQLTGEGIATAVPSLWGHLVFGLVTAAAWNWLARRVG